MFKEILKDVFPIIEKFAPTFATAIGSPAAGAATTFALSLLANKFGVKAENLHLLPDIINQDSDTSVKLNELEEQFSQSVKNVSQSVLTPSSVEITIKVNWDEND